MRLPMRQARIARMPSIAAHMGINRTRGYRAERQRHARAERIGRLLQRTQFATEFARAAGDCDDVTSAQDFTTTERFLFGEIEPQF